MVRQYVQVSDEQRKELVKLIHQDSFSIAKASKITGIPYDNAKAINRTYQKEQRVNKINYRSRYQKKVPASDKSDLKSSASACDDALTEDNEGAFSDQPKGNVPEIARFNNHATPENNGQQYYQALQQFQESIRQITLSAYSKMYSDIYSSPYSFSNTSPHPIVVPMAMRPIPHFQYGALPSRPKSSFGKFFDFANYTNKIIQRVTQHPQENVPSKKQPLGTNIDLIKLQTPPNHDDPSQDQCAADGADKQLFKSTSEIPNLISYLDQ